MPVTGSTEWAPLCWPRADTSRWQPHSHRPVSTWEAPPSSQTRRRKPREVQHGRYSPVQGQTRLSEECARQTDVVLDCSAGLPVFVPAKAPTDFATP